ncbi:MAG: hypothetical protein V9F03_05585 [Microthrixaceae bacterium]
MSRRRAGTPTTIVSAATSCSTTAPAPTRALGRIVDPRPTITPGPMNESLLDRAVAVDEHAGAELHEVSNGRVVVDGAAHVQVCVACRSRRSWSWCNGHRSPHLRPGERPSPDVRAGVDDRGRVMQPAASSRAVIVRRTTEVPIPIA